MRIWLLAVCALLAGCSSYESNFVTRTASGDYAVTRVNGVPVVVTVPQKLGFLVTETTYEVSTPVVMPDGTTGTPATNCCQVERSIDRNPISLGESQLVGLDVKRPMFGTAKTEMDLSNQYPTKVTSDVDDKTLHEALDAIEKTLLPQNSVEKQGEAVAAASTRRLVKQVQYMLVYDPRTGGFSVAQSVRL